MKWVQALGCSLTGSSKDRFRNWIFEDELSEGIGHLHIEMETDGENKSELEFLAGLENINPNFILYHIENLYASTEYYKETQDKRKFTHDSFQIPVKWVQARQHLIPKGIDLGDVKHFSYPRLAKYIDDINERYVIGKSMFGTFYHGWIKNDDSGVKDHVVIKTWDLYYPPRSDMRWQPRRLHNEIVLRTNLVQHPNLPRLIGYSIDKKLAVVYDEGQCVTLYNVLINDAYEWEDVLNIATQVAKLLIHFHEMNITVGSIDSTNILVDTNANIKLCEFALTARMTEMKYEKTLAAYVAGRFNDYAGMLYASEGDRWTIRLDIFAFGYLLLEMISKKNLIPIDMQPWLYKVRQNNKSDKLSLVDESLLEDANIGHIITELALNCVHETPAHRPTAEMVVNQLEELAIMSFGSAGSKKRKSIA